MISGMAGRHCVQTQHSMQCEAAAYLMHVSYSLLAIEYQSVCVCVCVCVFKRNGRCSNS